MRRVSGVEIPFLPLAIVPAVLLPIALAVGFWYAITGRCTVCDAPRGERHEYDCPKYWQRP